MIQIRVTILRIVPGSVVSQLPALISESVLESLHDTLLVLVH